MSALATLLQSGQVWRGDAPALIRAESTGEESLDRLLPGGGWPADALTEILYARAGIGEVSLVLPWLARLTQAGGRAAIVAPPHLPFAPALAQVGVVLARIVVVQPGSAESTQWAMEQLLRAACFGTVLAWPGATDAQALRRLQLAAETGKAIGILFRDARAAEEASPAALRLLASRDAQGFSVQILKCRGAAAGRQWRAAA